MVVVSNRALEQFVAAVGEELVLAQVLIRRRDAAYELRHVSDSGTSPASLRSVAVAELRSLAQFTAGGAFRPLKSAPNLQTGWRSIAANSSELDSALQHLYPGAVADWFAVQSNKPPVTNFREFTGRQSGMYRSTQLLTDSEAAPVIRACCHPGFCLKRRLWTTEGLAPDVPESKSLLMCLEPCAILLEFGRKAVRLLQAPQAEPSVANPDTTQAALDEALENPDVREADFNAPENPRRLQLLLEWLKK